MVSDEQLLEDLREFADEIGETPTQEQMDNGGPWTEKTYRYHFGSWNEALKEAGLNLNYNYPGSKEKLLQELRDFADEIGETPTKRQMNENGPWSETPYQMHFGSWNEALVEAGVEPSRKHVDSNKELLEYLREFADEIGGTPTQREMNKSGKRSSTTYQKYFGSWNEALKKAGLQINREVKHADSNEELLEDLREFADEIGGTPTKRQMKESGPWSESTYQKCFGSWNEALKEAGLEPIQEYKINTKWENGVDSYFGDSWPKARRQTLKRDEYTCQACGERDSPHVHHITPRRCFEVPDDSNTLDNLITLCASCHGTCEGRWTELEPDEFAERASELIKKT